MGTTGRPGNWGRAIAAALATVAVLTGVLATPALAGARSSGATTAQLAAFVQAAHADFLNRPPATDELDAWVDELSAGALTRAGFLHELVVSDEWLGAMVDRFYVDTLGRTADAQGRGFWIGILREGRMTPARVAAEFYASDEYFTRIGGNTLESWVADLYAKLLFREPDAAGGQFWRDVARTEGRSAVTVPFYQAPETRAGRVTRLYETLLGRDPDPGGRDYWSRVLDETGDDLRLAVYLAASDEYFQRAQARFPDGGGGDDEGSTLTGVVSLSTHRVLGTYDGDVGDAALDPGSYTIHGPGGGALDVVAVAPAGDHQVLITTAAQDAVDYVVDAPATNPRLTFTGSDAVEPTLVDATPVSSTQVLLAFSDPVGPGADAAASYTIGEAGSGATLAVLGAAVDGDEVMLTTATQAAVTYTVTVGDVQSSAGVYVDPTASSSQFLGVADVVAGPRLLTAATDGATGVVLTFDAPLDPDSATDVAAYTTTPGLFLRSATLQGDGRQVRLVTGTQFAVPYSLVANVTGVDGSPVNPSFDAAAFTGTRAVGTDRPKVTSAASTGNTSIVVQFSKPMADSTADPSRFVVLQTVTNPEVGALTVTGAEFVDDSRLAIRLTTLSQAEVTYQVTANNVTDILGDPLADRTIVGGVLLDPTSFVFPGTPPSYLPCPRPGAPDPCVVVDERHNSDDDTLWDHEETRGWAIVIALANGEAQQRQVTSSPFSSDTDADGLTDDTERALNIDPRDPDTDDDGLNDFAEFNEIFSDPAAQDTDADGLYDGLEVGFFRTSPIQADTDGDQRLDGDEINVNRNPKVSDLPASGLDVGQIDMRLDVRFDDTTTTGQTTSHEESTSATLSQSDSREYSTTDERTIEAASALSQTAGVSVELPTSLLGILVGDTKATVSYEATAEQSSSQSFTSSFTDTSAHETQRAYEDSLTSVEELTSGTSRTRTVEGATIKVSVMLRSVGDIAFTMDNVQLSALLQDPEDPSRLIPIATLVPEAPPPGGFSLGPLSPDRGPVIFASQVGQVFPQVVEDLMRSPRGVVVRFSNYDITDEQGRNFAFTSQDVYDRTGGLVIDYGSSDSDADGRGDPTENHRVATAIGRFVADTDGDGAISPDEAHGPEADSDDPTARYVAFDSNGDPVGITLREALATAGLTEYEEATTPTASLTPAQRRSSYSVVDVPGFGERIFRIREAERAPGKEWQIWSPTGLDRTLGLDDYFLVPGQTFRLTYVEDVDDDGVPGILEWVNGCSDTSRDSDQDSLDDRFETVVGWNVGLGAWRATPPPPTRVFSRCDAVDSDDDGLTDVQEAPSALTRDARGLVASGPALGPGRVAVEGTTLTGTDTTFLSTFAAGDSVIVGDEVRVVQAVASDTALTVTAAFTGTSTGRLYYFEADPPTRLPVGATFTAANEAEMLSLSATTGDFALRTDRGDLFQLVGDDPAVLADWAKAPTNDPLAGPVKAALADPVTDPGHRDTDADGTDDADELTPHRVRLQFPGLSDTPCDDDDTQTCTPPLVTSPEWADSDGDSASDGLEEILGGDPTQGDRDNFADDDGDGIVNVQETTGWAVITHAVSENPLWDIGVGLRHPCDSVCIPGDVDGRIGLSDPHEADTDDDGLDDREEMVLGTDPRRADTDGDGLDDVDEVHGFELGEFGTVVTDPLDADTDDDQRSDGDEADLGAAYVVRPEGESPYRVHTNPVDPDADFDRLVDGEELLLSTDPHKDNTDGDPRSDYVEAINFRNPLLPDMNVTMTFSRLLVTDDGESGDAGEFEFVLAGQGPNGPPVPAVHSFPTVRDGVSPITGLPTCGTQPPCRLETANPVIRIENGQTLTFRNGSTLGYSVDLGSVSMTDRVPQQFGVSGHLYERENDDNVDIDCWYEFPDPFAADGDGLGTVPGSEMELGTHSMAIHRKGSCNLQDNIEFTLFVSYTAS